MSSLVVRMYFCLPVFECLSETFGLWETFSAYAVPEITLQVMHIGFLKGQLLIRSGLVVRMYFCLSFM